MGFLTSLFSRRPAGRSDYATAFLNGDRMDGFGGYGSSAGVHVSRETALTYSAIWKGVNLISGDVGRLPTFVDRLEASGRRRAKEHPAYRLLRRKPNDYMPASVFKQTLQGHAIMEGNGYAYIWRNQAGEPIELTVCDPRRVTPVRANGVLWYVYTFASGERRKIPYTDVLHIRGFSFDGLIGYNLIHKAKESIGWALAMQTYGSVFFKNNATPRVVLEMPGKLKVDAAKNVRDSWERLYAGLENAHRTAVLEEGMKANKLSMDAEEAQLIEQLKFTFVDVANWLKLPPHKVGGEGRTAYASLAQENQAYLDDCLDGWLVGWEEEGRDKLLTEAEKETETHDVRFDRKQLLRANLPERASYYQTMVNLGAMSLDEVREEEGENPQPNGIGKVYQRPLNVAYIGADGKAVQMQPEPAPAAGPGAPSAVPPAPAAAPPAKSSADAANAERAATRRALASILKDAVRRMTKRIGLQAERSAGDHRKFMAWLDAIEAENGDTVREAFADVGRALAALKMPGNPAKWLLARLQKEYAGLADRCTPKELPSAAAALAAKLVEDLPGRAAKRFIESRCGGPGGTMGPCPEGGGVAGDGGDSSESSNDDQSPEEALQDAREIEDDETAVQRDDEDSAIADAREKEDTDTENAREAEDLASIDAREKEDKELDAARAKEDEPLDEADKHYVAKMREYPEVRSNEDAESQGQRDAEDKALEEKRAGEDKEMIERQTKETTEAENDPSVTEEQYAEMEERHIDETAALEDARADEDDKTAAAREKEDERTQKIRDKQDAELERLSEKTDAAREKLQEDRENEDDRIAAKREKEDDKTTAQREKDDDRRQKERDKADAAMDKARAKEDADRKKKREKEDAEINKGGRSAVVGERRCGGPGSGVPGPCPEGGESTKGIFGRAGEKAAELAKMAGELPAKIATAAKDKIKEKYKQAEDRYGRPMAIAIIAAGVAGLPLPVPGSSLLTAAPLIAAGEIYRAIKGKRGRRAEEDPDDYTEEEISQRGTEWLRAIMDEWEKDDLPKIESETKP